MKFFPTDIFSLIESGGYSFLKNNPTWPINDEKLIKIIRDFHNKFFIEAEKLENFNKNVLYVDMAILYFISYCAHFRILEKLLIKKGQKLKVNKNSKEFIKPNLKALLNPFYKDDLKEKLTIFAKFIIKYILNFSLFKTRKYLVVGSRAEIKSNKKKKKKISIIETYPQLFFKIHHDKSQINIYNKILTPILNSLLTDIKKEFKISIDLSDLLKVWIQRCTTISSTLSEMLKRDANYNGVLCTDIYLPTTRIIGAYFKMKKKKSISFDHGNHANARRKHVPLTYQFLPYNTFVTISKNSKISARSNANLSLMHKSLKNLNIEHIKNHYLRGVFKSYLKNKSNTKNKNIMIMGWPMNSRKYYDEGPPAFFWSKMLFELELIKFLKKNKFNVFYKPHPERLEGIETIYKEFVDKIFFEKFEDQDLKNIDTIIFTYTCTSTFGYSLCTNKKIILFYNENYFTEHMKLLKKRVKIIPSKYKKKYIADFNELLLELKKTNKKINYEYVKKYLI